MFCMFLICTTLFWETDPISKWQNYIKNIKLWRIFQYFCHYFSIYWRLHQSPEEITTCEVLQDKSLNQSGYVRTCWVTCRSRRGDDIRADLPGHLLQGSKLLLVDQIELSDEVVEVFVAGVDVGLGPDAHDPVEMMDVDVYEHSVQSGQDLLALWLESFGERNVRSDRKQLEYS